MATKQELAFPGWAWRDRTATQPVTSVRYRADIDGLRAIAVLAVILFHAGLNQFSGGFVGVDIFFVISGYLITSIILAEAEKGHFSLLSFYDRRIRRIFPALFLMLGGTAAIAWFTLLPTEMMLLGRTMAATAVFGANIYFWRETGYFAPQADENPLLHTWSLAVEEQFYVFFPLLLIFLLRAKDRRVVAAVFVVMALGSLAIAEWQVGIRPSASFYLLPMRAWELLLGALLSLGLLKAPGEKVAALCAAAGMAMIAWSILMFAPGMRFPGVSALLPCAGTALLIHAGSGGGTIATGLLSSRPMVFVGQISYSLYLWHWPLLIIPTLYYRRELGASETAVLIAAAFLFASMSLKYVETPFRKRKRADRKRQVVASGVVVSIAFFAFGVWMLVSDGVPWRYSEKVVAADRAQIREVLPANCIEIGSSVNRCADKEFEILVWGDSHAGHYFPAINRMAQSMGQAAQVQTIGGCPPLLGVEPVTVPRPGTAAGGKRVRFETGCAAANQAILDLIESRPEIRAVALAGAWSFWTEATEIGTGEGRYLASPGSRDYSLAETRRLMRDSLARTIDALRANGVRILLLGQIPDKDLSPSWCMADAYRRSLSSARCAPATKAALDRLDWSRELLSSAAGGGDPINDGIFFFDPAPILCRGERCLIEMGGAPLYRDSNHLTEQGAISLGRYFMHEMFLLTHQVPRSTKDEVQVATLKGSSQL